MFTSSRGIKESFSKNRAGKSISKSRRSFKEHSSFRRPNNLDLASSKQDIRYQSNNGPTQAQLNSATVTIAVGSPARLFAAHLDVLALSSGLASALRSQFYNASTRRLDLPDEIPEVFSSVLEFLYKTDYSPRLVYDARRQAHALDTASGASVTVWISSSNPGSGCMSPTSLSAHPADPRLGTGVSILKDTAVYCAADRYDLPQLKKLALRKQGLQSSIPVATILASAKFAYAHTPEHDRHLRAHYLALIIRSRNTFKRSGTMQVEMGAASPPRLGAVVGRGEGTALWFDLFVAMCNHLDDLEQLKSPRH